MEYGSHVCSVIYAYIELMFHIEFYRDSCYTHIDNCYTHMPMYTNVII